MGGLFFCGLFGCRAVFRYFPLQLRFSHSLGGFTVNRAFFTIFRQAEGGGRFLPGAEIKPICLGVAL